MSFGGVAGTPGGAFAAEARNKIVEMATNIVKECTDGLA